MYNNIYNFLDNISHKNQNSRAEMVCEDGRKPGEGVVVLFPLLELDLFVSLKLSHSLQNRITSPILTPCDINNHHKYLGYHRHNKTGNI